MTESTHEPTRAKEQFQPRVEGEEGDPTRVDAIIAAIVALVVIVGILWAMGVINWPS
jgi:hypothetical protein